GEDLPPPLGLREDPFCTVHARTKKVSTTAALSHANGRLNPHQKGAPSSIPTTKTTIPEGRGHSSRTPPTTWTTQAARKPASSGTVVGTPIRSKGPLPSVGSPKVEVMPRPATPPPIAGIAKPPNPNPLTMPHAPAIRRHQAARRVMR